jgi:hypothetical protein
MSYTCKTCGAQHEERPTCFVAELPAVVADLDETAQAARVERGPEQCVLDGEHFCILGNLDVPFPGPEGWIRWTVWSTLSREHFGRAADLWETPGREAEGPYFGWLSNQIPGYPPSVNIKALVHTQPVGIRPKIEVIEEDHPLTHDQQKGITLERAEALIHAALHPSAA